MRSLSEGAPPFQAKSDGIAVAIHLMPKASVERVGEAAPTANGVALKVKVTAAPDKGRANAALLRLLAKEWGLAARHLTLASGKTSRHKVVRVTGDGARQTLEAWWAERR